VRLSPLATSATNWPTVPAPDDGWAWSIWWNVNWQGKQTCPTATLFTTNPTRLDLQSNPGRRGGKAATNRLSYGTASPSLPLNDVAYRPVAKRWLCKQRPLLGNASNIHAHNNTVSVENDVFCLVRAGQLEQLVSWVLQERLRRNGAIVELTVQLWDIRRTETTRAQKLKNLHC
jgi:hypothetical protein